MFDDIAYLRNLSLNTCSVNVLSAEVDVERRLNEKQLASKLPYTAPKEKAPSCCNYMHRHQLHFDVSVNSPCRMHV